jgi:hypothetical protein
MPEGIKVSEVKLLRPGADAAGISSGAGVQTKSGAGNSSIERIGKA